MFRRILIKGGSGSGKSTLGRQLAQSLDLPYVELDALYHGPNWTAATDSELRARVQAVLDDDRGWIVDGNYDGKLGPLILDRADFIVWLDFPLHIKLMRLARRTATRWFHDEELWNGNHETLKDAFWGRDSLFPWAIRSHFRHRRQFPSMLARHPLVRLRTVREAARWFPQIRPSSP